MEASLDSKFRLILVAAKRARQLQAGAKPLAHSPSKKPAKIAAAELDAGLVPYDTAPAPHCAGSELKN